MHRNVLSPDRCWGKSKLTVAKEYAALITTSCFLLRDAWQASWREEDKTKTSQRRGGPPVLSGKQKACPARDPPARSTGPDTSKREPGPHLFDL